MRSAFILGTGLMLLAIVVFFGACGGGGTTPPVENSNAAVVTDAAASDVTAAYSVEFTSEPAPLQANQPSTLSFTVKDKRGGIVKDLQIVHEKPMHLLIVSTDLAEFYHVHPEQFPDGSYRVQHTFPNGGDYKLYADFTPPNARQVVERVDLKVAGPERAKVSLIPDTRFEKSVDGLKVVMRPDRELEAGQDVMLHFQAFDAASGKPATDLQNYLGELAHFVIISVDMVDFVHAHPMSDGEPMSAVKLDSGTEKDHNADEHSHSSDTNDRGSRSGSEVSAHTSFPRAGVYKLWAQFQRRGKVISVPFIVKVPAGTADAAAAENIPPDATRIIVSEAGYQPAVIPVKKGRPVRLAFYRADANNCGGEVVFPEQNIRKKLPVGKTVLIEFTPAKSGEIGFACGMDMLRGKLIVSET